MDFSQSCNILTPRPNISTMPEEILFRILAFVPYPGPMVTEVPIAIKQHDSLRLVSPRFNAVLSDNAFKIQLARCQFNDIVQLYDVKTIKSNTDLREIATHSENADSLVERLLRDDKDNIRSFLRLGVLVLDYLKSANTYSTNKDWMTLIVWANETVFSSDFRQVLRFAIARLQDTFVTDPQDPISTISPHILSGVALEDPVIEIAGETMYGMFKYRAFETAILLASRPLSLLAANGPNFRHILSHARAEHQSLVGCFHFYALNLHLPEDASFVLGAARKAADTKYWNGYQWRALSPRVERILDWKHNADFAFTAMMNAAVTELRVRTEFGISGYMPVVSVDLLNTFDKLDLDLNAVGHFLRGAAHMIKSKDKSIPKHIVKHAREVDLLRGITDEEANEDDESEDIEDDEDMEDNSNEENGEEDTEDSDNGKT